MMKQSTFLCNLAIVILIPSALNGMKKAKFALGKLKKNSEACSSSSQTEDAMKEELRRRAQAFTQAAYPVPLAKYLEFHNNTKPTYRELAEKRKSTPPIDPDLQEVFRRVIEESDGGNEESSKKVVLLGTELLIKGASFDEIHPAMKRAGNILRGNSIIEK